VQLICLPSRFVGCALLVVFCIRGVHQITNNNKRIVTNNCVAIASHRYICVLRGFYLPVIASNLFVAICWFLGIRGPPGIQTNNAQPTNLIDKQIEPTLALFISSANLSQDAMPYAGTGGPSLVLFDSRKAVNDAILAWRNQLGPIDLISLRESLQNLANRGLSTSGSGFSGTDIANEGS
jgi:hypothetical protein